MQLFWPQRLRLFCRACTCVICYCKVPTREIYLLQKSYTATAYVATWYMLLFIHHRYGSELVASCNIDGGDVYTVCCNAMKTSFMLTGTIIRVILLGLYSHFVRFPVPWRSSATNRNFHFGCIICCWCVWSNGPGDYMAIRDDSNVMWDSLWFRSPL